MDVIDPRIDVGAQRSILRMRRGDAAARADGEALLSAVTTGRIAGIFGDDLRAAAQLAARRGTVRWKLVAPGQDASLVEDPAGPPAIIFREQARGTPARLDPALRRLVPGLRPPVHQGPPPPGVPVLVPRPDGTAEWIERPKAPAVAFRLANVGPTEECPSRCGTSNLGPNAVVSQWICRISGVFTLSRILGVSTNGSGALIGPCHVLTAGHVVHSLVADLDGKVGQRTASSLTVTPRDHDRMPPPFGHFTVVRARASINWVVSGATAERHDYGLLTLNRPAPRPVGRWRVRPGVAPGTTALPTGLAVSTGGYSGQCPPAQRQHFRSGQVMTTGDVASVALESSSGHSGSPAWTLTGGPTLRGVVISTNVARVEGSNVCETRILSIRPEILAEIRSWVDDDVREGVCRHRPNVFLGDPATLSA